MIISEKLGNDIGVGVANPWLTSEARLHILIFLAQFHCAVDWQICRSLCGHEESLALKKLAKVRQLLADLELKRWINRLDNVPLPKAYGGATATVYFLERGGLETLKKAAPQLSGRAKYGRPRGEMRQRLGHDLHVTEAVCHISKHCRVLDFVDEDSLKSRLGIKKGSAIGPVEDFQVTVVRHGKPAQETELYRCEVTISAKADQIRGKPDGVIFFVCDEKEGDKIKQIRGMETSVRLLNLLPPISQSTPESSRASTRSKSISDQRSGSRRAAPSRTQKRPDGTLRPLAQRVLKALSLVGAADCSALGAMINHDRTGVSRCLAALAGDLVRREEFFLRPVRSAGAPTILYVPIDAPRMDCGLRAHFVVVSKVIFEARRLGYLFEMYDRDKGVLALTPEVGALETVWVVVDNPSLPLTKLRQRYEAARYTADKYGGEAFTAVAGHERWIAFRNMIPHDELYDFFKWRDV